jgi:hypothetical protein
LLAARSELERRFVERETVVLGGNGESLAEPAGARAEQVELVEAAPSPHLGDAVTRLEGADQNRFGKALGTAHEVETPVDPVRPVDVGAPGRAEHRCVPLGAPAKAMRRRVLVVVRLDLDDGTANVVYEELHADELGRDLVDGTGEEVAGELHSF